MQKNYLEVRNTSSIENQYGLKQSKTVSCSTADPKISMKNSRKSDSQSQQPFSKYIHITICKRDSIFNENKYQKDQRSVSRKKRKFGISLSNSLTKKFSNLYESRDFQHNPLINTLNNTKNQRKQQKIISIDKQYHQSQINILLRKSISLSKKTTHQLDNKTFCTGKRDSRLIQKQSSITNKNIFQDQKSLKQSYFLDLPIKQNKQAMIKQLSPLDFLRINHQQTYLSMEEYFPSNKGQKISSQSSQQSVIRVRNISIDRSINKKFSKKSNFRQIYEEQQKKKNKAEKKQNTGTQDKYYFRSFIKNKNKYKNSRQKVQQMKQSLQFTKKKNKQKGKYKNQWQVISSLDTGPICQSVHF